ncbi:MAG: anti-sigma regulatory factor [Opitutaceae bacterium]|jgi:anti-sigma regulatory factor (Ser/Thr protein kinase)
MKPLVLPGRLESLDQVADYIHAAATEAGFDKKIAYKLHLAVDEVATNIVTHAYQEKGIDGEIYLNAVIDDKDLTLHVEDTGEAYDPTTREAPADLDKPLEERGVGGLGIFLAKRSVDSLHYERRGDRNRMTFVLHRNPTPPL